MFDEQVRPAATNLKNHLPNFLDAVNAAKAAHDTACEDLVELMSKENLTASQTAELEALKKLLKEAQQDHDSKKTLWTNVTGAAKFLNASFKTDAAPAVKRPRIT